MDGGWIGRKVALRLAIWAPLFAIGAVWLGSGGRLGSPGSVVLVTALSGALSAGLAEMALARPERGPL